MRCSSASAAAACSSGSALATRALSPACKLYGVEPEAGNDAPAVVPQPARSSTSTRRRRSPTARRRSRLGQLTFEIIRRDVDDVLTATDAELVDAMRFFASRMKMIVEPTGGLGFAAARADADGSWPASASAC